MGNKSVKAGVKLSVKNGVKNGVKSSVKGLTPIFFKTILEPYITTFFRPGGDMEKIGRVTKIRDGLHGVRLTWAGADEKLCLIPTEAGQFPCTNRDMAKGLQTLITNEVIAGTFRPERYKKGRAFTVETYGRKWLALMVPTWAAGTAKPNIAAFENYIIPQLGGIPLTQIDKDAITAFRTYLLNDAVWFRGKVPQDAEKRKANARRGLSPKRTKNIIAVFRQMLSDAYDNGKIDRMPVFPRATGKAAVVVTKKQTLSIEVREAILDRIPANMRPIYEFIFFTGCRPSEAKAFKWADIDAEKGLLWFRSTIGWDGQEKEVKGKHVEPVPMSERAADALIAAQELKIDQFSKYCFLNPATKKRFRKNALYKAWDAACMAVLGHKYQLNYAGRHSFATDCLQSGMDARRVGRMLRHAIDGGRTVLNHYADYDVIELAESLSKVQTLKALKARRKAVNG